MSKQLQALERWRSQQLDEARSRHAQLASVAAEKAVVVEEAEVSLRESQALSRELLGTPLLRVPTLQRLAAFSAQKADELAAARKVAEQARKECDVAHASLLQHLERLSAVERLIERRKREAMQEADRVAHRMRDEQALVKLGGR